MQSGQPQSSVFLSIRIYGRPIQILPARGNLKRYFQVLFLQCCSYDFFFTEPSDPCAEYYCGANSVQRVKNGQCICSCQEGFIDIPPNCRPECVTNSQCPENKACARYKCFDPCVGVCGSNALCKILIEYYNFLLFFILTLLSRYCGGP